MGFNLEMAVYVDTLRSCKPNRNWRWKESCHLSGDSIEELHKFAKDLGLKESWFQNTRFPHFDLTRKKRELAIELGAEEIR